jgi:predicted Zn-dependent protease
VNASPWRDVKDPPQVTHTYEMVQAKLAGFTLPAQEALDRYPESNTSEPARYARAMIYLRKPDLPKALSSTNSLITDEPNNPFFYEVLGQIYVSMAKPMLAIPAYQKAVDLRPNAPQLRLGLAVAQLATEDPRFAGAALQNLKAASLVENDDVFTWYETAQAYSTLKNEPMANLSTAEAYYNAGSLKQAGIFALRARSGLAQGSPDWERANDIISTASTPQQR